MTEKTKKGFSNLRSKVKNKFNSIFKKGDQQREPISFEVKPDEEDECIDQENPYLNRGSSLDSTDSSRNYYLAMDPNSSGLPFLPPEHLQEKEEKPLEQVIEESKVQLQEQEEGDDALDIDIA